MDKTVIITKTARKKMAKARAGETPLPKISGMVFGSGGVDEGGNVKYPEPEQTSLKNELYRQAIDGYKFISETTVQYKCTLSETTIPNTLISEIGLYDEEGDVVCIKNFLAKGKDNDLEMVFTIDDIF
jgi:hypothetical protein